MGSCNCRRRWQTLPMTDYISVYITAASSPEAEAIAETLVANELAACVNILPSMRSVYRWHGNVETSTETALIVKTRADLFSQIEERTKALSSYACPCIVAWPIINGHQPYLDWIGEVTT